MKARARLRRLVPPVAVLLVAACWLVSRLCRRYQVANRSMLPTLAPGDRVLVNTLAFKARSVDHGDIVVYANIRRHGLEEAKRVVAVPGNHVTLRHGEVLVEHRHVALEPASDAAEQHVAAWRLGAEEYFLVGDNLLESRDSRHDGPVRRGQLRGLIWYRYWPPHRRGSLYGRATTAIH